MSGSASTLLPSPPRLAAALRGRILYVAPGSSLPLAIAKAEQDNIEVLHLPPGEFNIGQHSFPNDLIITGSGKDVTIINGSFTATRNRSVLILEDLTLNAGEGIGIFADSNILIPTQQEVDDNINIPIIDFEITMHNVKMANTNNGRAFQLVGTKSIIHNITMNISGECEFIVTGNVNANIIYFTITDQNGIDNNLTVISISGNLSIIYPTIKRCQFLGAGLLISGTLYTKNVEMVYSNMFGFINRYIHDYDRSAIIPIRLDNTVLDISILYINKSGNPILLIGGSIDIKIGKLYVNGSGFTGVIPGGLTIGGVHRLN